MNILLGVGTIFVGIVTGSWIIGAILVLVSKWRMFAVRSRYLFLNLKSNLVDLIVGFSFVFLGYFAGSELVPGHWILAGLYVIWLLFVKPKTKAGWNVVQAICAVILGTSAAVIASAHFNPVWLVILEFIIGYAAARHVLVQNDSAGYDGFAALIYGVMFAEIALVSHYWLIVYSFEKVGLMVPQLAVVLGIVSFLTAQLYGQVEKRDGVLKFRDVAPAVLFSAAMLIVLLMWFSKPSFNI